MDVSLKTRMTAYYPCVLPAFNGRYHGDQRFPEGTRGFLYYSEPKAGIPPAAGELRFRVIPGNTPASFAQGHDLQLKTGLPWCISLMAIVENSNVRKGQHYESIRRLLLDDGFVTPALLEKCAAMRNCKKLPVCRSRIIHSFGQLFYIKFDATSFCFYSLSMDQLQHHVYGTPYYYNSLFSGQYAMVA
jgi:hypothetical protein